MNYFKAGIINKGVIFLFLLLVFGLTFLREILFLDINSVINNQDYNNTYSYFFHLKLIRLNSSEIIRLKWVLTFLFSITISGLSILVIYLWFKNSKNVKYAIFFFLFVYTSFVGVGFFLWYLNGLNEYYFVLRKITGFIQSPLPLMIMIPVFMVLENK